ncbi:MAG: phosphotransferase [Actinomycetes bacterium]
MADDALPRWRDPQWQRIAMDWTGRGLAELGCDVTGEPEQVKARPWSTVFRVPTTRGPFWFKANARGLAHEAALVEALSRWVPDRVLAPLRVDADQGWLLLPDGGRTLREAQGGTTDLAHWERILVEYAQLQRSVAPFAAEMLALGVPDNRPDALPAVLEDLLTDADALLLDQPSGMTGAQLAEQRAAAPSYARMCAELAAIGIPPSVQHDDLHDANVFVPADESEPYRVFDWGDATVAHPFASLLVSLRVLCDLANLAPGSPPVLHLRDAYLEVWSAEHDIKDLRQACRLAVRVGAVGRAANWRRALLEATPAGRAQWGDGVPGWLLELNEPTPVEPGPPVG